MGGLGGGREKKNVPLALAVSYSAFVISNSTHTQKMGKAQIKSFTLALMQICSRQEALECLFVLGVFGRVESDNGQFRIYFFGRRRLISENSKLI